MKNNLKYCEIEVQGFQDLCNRVKELEAENERLEHRNCFLERAKEALKLNLRQATDELRIHNQKLNNVCAELAYYQQRCADLEEDFAEEKAIADGERFYYEMGAALYGDGF